MLRRCATACGLTVEALASGCTHNLPCGLTLLLHSATVADLLPADVPALSRGESHHKTRLRKERPVLAVGIEKVCGPPTRFLCWSLQGVTVMLSCIDLGARNIFFSLCRSSTHSGYCGFFFLAKPNVYSVSVQLSHNRWFEEFLALDGRHQNFYEKKSVLHSNVI